MSDLVTFTYAALEPALADRLRGQAERIRQRIAGQTESMIETGRDLAAVKASTEHGTFIAWVEAECGIHPRMAQMYMRAAEWAEANTKLISHLQPTAVLKLSGKSTPADVVATVTERIENGEAVTPTTVEGLLREAREEKKEQERLAKEAALPKRTREARAAREAREAKERDEDHRKRAEEKEGAARESDELAGILVRHLDNEILEHVKSLLLNKSVTKEYHCYMDGKGTWRVRLVDVIEALQRREGASTHRGALPKYTDLPIKLDADDDPVDEGGIMDLWVREATDTFTPPSFAPIEQRDWEQDAA